MHNGPKDGMIQLERENHRERGSETDSGSCGGGLLAHNVVQRSTGGLRVGRPIFRKSFCAAETLRSFAPLDRRGRLSLRVSRFVRRAGFEEICNLLVPTS